MKEKIYFLKQCKILEIKTMADILNANYYNRKRKKN